MRIVSIIEDGSGNVIGVRYEDESTEALPVSEQPTREALESEPGTVVDAVAAILEE